MVYIDVTSYNDFDTVIRFLLQNGITIAIRDKVKGQIAAELSPAQQAAFNALKFEDFVYTGDAFF